MEFDRELLLRTFLSEGAEILAAMEEALLALEQRPEDGKTLRALLRAAHTLKGDAACLGLDYIAAVLQRVEDYLQQLRAGDAEIDPATVTKLLTFVDSMRGTVAAAACGEEIVSRAALDIAEQLSPPRL